MVILFTTERLILLPAIPTVKFRIPVLHMSLDVWLKYFSIQWLGMFYLFCYAWTSAKVQCIVKMIIKKVTPGSLLSLVFKQ
jgi:hypothetical protein